jgi:hypothetical protein
MRYVSPCQEQHFRYVWMNYRAPGQQSIILSGIVDPERYLRCGFLKCGHSRRLARFTDPLHGFKAYIGLHHADPASLGAPGPARTRYFLSLFVPGKASTLRTYTTLTEARAALQAAYEQLIYSLDTDSGRASDDGRR